MKRLFPCLFAVIAFATTMTSPVAAAGGRADVPSPTSRKPTVALALRLAAREELPPLPADLVQPFNPAAFGQPDPEELRAIAAARAAAAAASQQSKPTTDNDFLKIIAERIMPSGTVILGGEPMLIFGKKRLRIGDRLTVTYDGRDYELVVTAIERTTFSLRLNQDEITRPIKPGKSP